MCFFQLEQNTFKNFLCFYALANKPLFKRVPAAGAAETVVAQKADSATSTRLWRFHSFLQLVVVLPAIHPVTTLPAAFFPAPHQPRALVWRSRHRGSGGITAGSLVSNRWLSFVVSSIAGVKQILFQRGS